MKPQVMPRWKQDGCYEDFLSQQADARAMPPLKTERTEFSEADSKPDFSVKAESGDLPSQELQDAAAVAGHLDLPLVRINVWSAEQKRKWLKCMLAKHINWYAMEPSQKLVTANLLNEVNASLHENADAPLGSLIGQVESILACQVVGQMLRSELAVWQLAAASECLSAARSLSHSPSSSDSGKGSCCSRSSSSSGCRRSNRSHGGCSNGDLLWEHIVRMLETGHHAVRWVLPEQGLFQFVHSGAAARSWGATKSNENMSFEKMSRSIRQYYRPSSGVMIKVPNKGRLLYKLNVRHPHVVRFLTENFAKSACLKF